MTIDFDFWVKKYNTDIEIIKSEIGLIKFATWCIDNNTNEEFVDFYFRYCIGWREK